MSKKKFMQTICTTKKDSSTEKILPPPPFPPVISNGPPLIFIDCKICYHYVLKLGYITQKKGEFDNTLSIYFRIEMEEM